MTRLLALIAGIGFIVSIICFSGAVALGGNAIRSGWDGWDDWNIHVRETGDNDVDISIGDGEGDDPPGSGGQMNREIPWDGSNHVELGVSAELRYTQAGGPPRLTITGPREAVEHVTVTNGRIHYDSSRRHRTRRLLITLSAPNVTRFDINGSDRLVISNYRQDSLTIDASGATDISASGQARTVSVDLSGSSEADLANLAAEDADVDISGSAEATIAPTRAATIDISGSGEVTLTTNPPVLRTDVSGSGRVHTRSDATAAPTPPSPPAANAAPPTPPTPPAPSRK